MKFIRSAIMYPTLVLGFIYPADAWAYTWISEVKVTAIEVTYVPTSVPFYVDKAVGDCTVGAPLTWVARGNSPDEKNQNAQGVLATLLTAKSSGQAIRVYVIPEGCRVEYLYIK